MDMDLKVLIATYAMIIAIFVMTLFISKYYALFDLSDKIIIEYIKIVIGIGVLIFCSLDYPNSNSFFLFMIPPGILISIYKLNKLHRLNDNVVSFSLKDRMVIKSLEILTMLGMAIGIYITSKSGMLFMAAVPFIYVIYNINKMVKQYRTETNV